MSYRVKLEFTCDGADFQVPCPHNAKGEGYAEIREVLGGAAIQLDVIERPIGWRAHNHTTGDICPTCLDYTRKEKS